jgi:hypothetical protein
LFDLNIIAGMCSQMEEVELLVDAASRLSEPFLLVIVVILGSHEMLILTSSITYLMYR